MKIPKEIDNTESDFTTTASTSTKEDLNITIPTRQSRSRCALPFGFGDQACESTCKAGGYDGGDCKTDDTRFSGVDCVCRGEITYSDVSEIFIGPDGRCGYRRGTYCFGQLSTMFAGCATSLTPNLLDLIPGDDSAAEEYECISEYMTVLHRCRECMSDTCQTVLGPLGMNDYCQFIAASVEKILAR